MFEANSSQLFQTWATTRTCNCVQLKFDRNLHPASQAPVCCRLGVRPPVQRFPTQAWMAAKKASQEAAGENKRRNKNSSTTKSETPMHGNEEKVEVARGVSSRAPDGSPNQRGNSQTDQVTMLYGKALGDAVMIAATHVASERIELAQQPVLIATVVSVWWLVSGSRGNYSPRTSDVQIGYFYILDAVTESLITWVLATVVVLGAYSLMVSNQVLEPDLVLPLKSLFSGTYPSEIPCELEVLLALVVTMTCWRGMLEILRAR